MDTRFLSGITDTLEWNLVSRQDLQAQQVGNDSRIQSRTFLITTNVAAIGLKNSTSPPNFYLGGWANCYANFTPSSQSEFVAAVKIHSERLKIGSLNLLVVPRVTVGFFLQLDFPRWHQTMSIEVWRYDGPDETIFDRL